MEQNNVIMKCCVCQRIKTDRGWQYRFIPFEHGEAVSHGYCPSCYQKAIVEIENAVVSNVLQVAR